MPIAAVNDREYTANQYRDARNLQRRLYLHQHFSVNPVHWHVWVFDHLELPPNCRVLELGCGSGDLWLENIERIPSGWEITLSDFSPGMLAEARRNLDGKRTLGYRVIDAQNIPFGDGQFDAVIANHMLYHVPDREAALQEIRRVLRPGGRFYASTIGGRHLAEIAELLTRFDANLASWRTLAAPFTMENGADQLARWFGEVQMFRYEDALEVNELDPLVDYILSGRISLSAAQEQEFRRFVALEMRSCGGVFHVTKESGLFTSVRT